MEILGNQRNMEKQTMGFFTETKFYLVLQKLNY
jgi:hypothetical protein